MTVTFLTLSVSPLAPPHAFSNSSTQLDISSLIAALPWLILEAEPHHVSLPALVFFTVESSHQLILNFPLLSS
jgi:hypothetical protein